MAEERCLFQARVVCLCNNLIYISNQQQQQQQRLLLRNLAPHKVNTSESLCRRLRRHHRAQPTHRVVRLSSPSGSTKNSFVPNMTLSPKSWCASGSPRTSIHLVCITCIQLKCRASARRRKPKAAAASGSTPRPLFALYSQTPSTLAVATTSALLRPIQRHRPLELLAWKVRHLCLHGRTQAFRCLPVAAARRFFPHENPCFDTEVALADTCTSQQAPRFRPSLQRRKRTPARFGSACFKFPSPPLLQKSSAHLQQSANLIKFLITVLAATSSTIIDTLKINCDANRVFCIRFFFLRHQSILYGI